MSEEDGLPTFSATVTGIDATSYPNQYFYIDLTSTNTISWGIDCTHDAMGSYLEGSCSTKPTLMKNYFDGSDLPTVPLVTSFNDQVFGGYTVSGQIYLSEVCFGTINCQAMNVYSGDTVSKNEWNWNEDGAYGIIGLGVNSGLWNSFTNPGNLTATYSIELARFSNPMGIENVLKADSS